jgi:hypothetical protein
LHKRPAAFAAYAAATIRNVTPIHPAVTRTGSDGTAAAITPLATATVKNVSA